MTAFLAVLLSWLWYHDRLSPGHPRILYVRPRPLMSILEKREEQRAIDLIL